jgi:hypothetical protein
MDDRRERSVADVVAGVAGELERAISIVRDVDSHPVDAERLAEVKRLVAAADMHLAEITSGDTMQIFRTISGTRLAADACERAVERAEHRLCDASGAAGRELLRDLVAARNSAWQWLGAMWTGVEVSIKRAGVVRGQQIKPKFDLLKSAGVVRDAVTGAAMRASAVGDALSRFREDVIANTGDAHDHARKIADAFAAWEGCTEAGDESLTRLLLRDAIQAIYVALNERGA